jgi:predicted permease
MLSARALARRREMALRTALGARRARLVRQLLTESLLLFVFGAGGGVAVAMLATAALERLTIPGDASLSLELSPDPRVLAFALGVSLLTGIVFGLAPALRASRSDITSRLREDSASTGTRRSFIGNALIVGQLSLSLVLLVAAGLFMRALDEGSRVDPGFDTSGVATASFNAESWGYDDARGRLFYARLREMLVSQPGVSAVAFAGRVPLALNSSGTTVRIDGASGTANRDGRVPIQLLQVDGGFFDAMRIPVVSGRAFTEADGERAARVAIVNERFASSQFAGGSAIGRTFEIQGHEVTIVGIARDAKYGSLSEQLPAFAYFPLAQMWQANQVLFVRTSGDPLAVGPAIQQAVRAIDGVVPRPVVSTLERETSIVLLPQRVAAIVTGVLGGVGLLLATVGLYGIIAYSASRRTREIGVRLALGARQADVLGMIVGEGMRLTGYGVLLGLLLAAAATRLIAGLLFSVSPLDLVAFSGMALLFTIVALLASFLPARRAAATSPMTALRMD